VADNVGTAYGAGNSDRSDGVDLGTTTDTGGGTLAANNVSVLSAASVPDLRQVSACGGGYPAANDR